MPIHLPTPTAPFPSSSPVLNAGTQRSSRLSGLSLLELLGCLAPRETSEGGGGKVPGVSRNLGSHRLPLSPSPSRRGSSSGHRGRMSQARGRAARGAGPWRGAGASLLRHPRGGGSLWGKGAPLPVPAAGRGAAGRRHKMHSVRELLPSEVTGRYAPGRGQGFAAQASPPLPRKTKGTRGQGREKFSVRLQMDLIETSRPKRRRGGLVGGVRMRGGLPRASRQDPHRGVSQSCGRPRTVRTDPALQPPLLGPTSSSRMQTASPPTS